MSWKAFITVSSEEAQGLRCLLIAVMEGLRNTESSLFKVLHHVSHGGTPDNGNYCCIAVCFDAAAHISVTSSHCCCITYSD